MSAARAEPVHDDRAAVSRLRVALEGRPALPLLLHTAALLLTFGYGISGPKTACR